MGKSWRFWVSKGWWGLAKIQDPGGPDQVPLSPEFWPKGRLKNSGGMDILTAAGWFIDFCIII